MKHMNQRMLAYICVVSIALMAALPALSAPPKLPKRDLTVALRQMEEGDSSGYSVSTQPRDAFEREQYV
jgi:hypothetical protein